MIEFLKHLTGSCGESHLSLLSVIVFYIIILLNENIYKVGRYLKQSPKHKK